MREAVSWNVSKGGRSRIHYAGDGHDVTICGAVVSSHRDAEVERRSDFPITNWSKEARRRICMQCINIWRKMEAEMPEMKK